MSNDHHSQQLRVTALTVAQGQGATTASELIADAMAIAAYIQGDAPAVVTDEMVNRFLSWPVPADVCPDGTPGQPGRLGTNLLTAEQAKAMLRHVLGV